MKNLINLTIFICLALGSCTLGGNEENRVNAFLKEKKHPVIVSTKRGYYADTAKRNVTLLSSDRQVLFLENTYISLPDTIK